jgi:putative hydrolase of HD superfamily
MDDVDSRHIVEFFRHIHRLKAIKRSGWLRHKIHDPESVASHMYGVAVLAWILSHGKDVDLEKLLKLSLVHDLGEALAGDLTPYDKEYKHKRQIEEDKLRDVVAVLPPNMQKEVLSLHAEVAERQTKEAEIVATADRLDMALTAAEYEKSGVDLSEFFDIETSHFTEKGHRLLKYLKSLRNSE